MLFFYFHKQILVLQYLSESNTCLPSVVSPNEAVRIHWVLTKYHSLGCALPWKHADELSLTQCPALPATPLSKMHWECSPVNSTCRQLNLPAPPVFINQMQLITAKAPMQESAVFLSDWGLCNKVLYSKQTWYQGNSQQILFWDLLYRFTTTDPDDNVIMRPSRSFLLISAHQIREN